LREGNKLMESKKVIIPGLFLLFITFIFTLMVGRYHLDLETLFNLIGAKINGLPVGENLATSEAVLWLVRIPRALMVVIVGAALSVSGVVFQGLFRNPLVSPDILGVSSGACFGAALAILLVGQSAVAVEMSAFIWGLLAVTIAYQIGRRGNNSITTLVLAGVIVSALFTAGLSFLKYVADPYEELPAIVFWTMGGFNYTVWADLGRALPLIAGGLTALYLLRWRLNLLALGSEEAMMLGMDVNRSSLVYIVLVTLIVAASISACGSIAWVGLVVPHMARLLVGPDHKILIPFSALVGAIFLLLMDTLARTLTGAEIPISIITSFVGAPFLAYLLLKQENRQWQD